MKVAVCLSGSVKHPEKSLDSIRRIYPNEYLKVFIHTWKIENKKEYARDSFSGKLGLADLEVLSEYNAEDIFTENYNEKRLEFESMYDRLDFSPGNRADIGVISMYYSIFKSNELKCKYEKNNNIIFDKVIRMRFDSDFGDKDLTLDPNVDTIQIPLGNDWGGINDQFALGPSKEMNSYSDLFNKFEDLQGTPYNPETLLLTHITKNLPENSIGRFQFDIQINGN
jgi:hypothetical protein